jgi:hypothetical protein
VVGNNTQQMPESVAAAYNVLDYDLKLIWFNYKMLMDLYGHSELRSSLLRASAPDFFADLLSLLRSDLLLRVTRLTEDTGTRTRESIVLKSLPTCFDDYAVDTIGIEYTSVLHEIDNHVTLIARVRHKTVAHRDKAVALGLTPDPSVNISYADIKNVMMSAGKALNLVSRHYGGPTVLYEESIESLQGVPAIIQCLKWAQWTRERIQSDPMTLMEIKRGQWWLA